NIGPVSIREFRDSLSSKLANRLGRSIAKLRNTHVLSVIVTSGTQRRLFRERGILMHRTAPMKDRACGHAHARRLGIDAGPRCENVSAHSVAIRFPPMPWSTASAACSPNGRGVSRKQKVSQ